MTRVFLLVAACVFLAGCKSAAERAEIADDESCRRLVVERSDSRPTAYQECRSNLMAYRQQRAVSESGRVVINNNQGRNPLCGPGAAAAGLNC